MKSGKQLIRRSVQHLYPLELNQAQDVLQPNNAVTVEREVHCHQRNHVQGERAEQRIQAMYSELDSEELTTMVANWWEFVGIVGLIYILYSQPDNYM